MDIAEYTSPFSTEEWDVIDEMEIAGRQVNRLSCAIDNRPGLLVLERFSLTVPATSALVQMRFTYTKLEGISGVTQLEDVDSPIGTFVRRVFVLRPQSRRTVLASAVEVNDGLDAVVQFVLPIKPQDEDILDAFSLLSVAKVLELYQLDSMA